MSLNLDVPTGHVTTEDLQAIMQGHTEDTDTPNKILAALRYNDGKQLTKTTVKKMIEATGIEDLRIVKQFGMTNLGWGQSRGGLTTTAHELLIAHREKNVVIDADWIEENNACFFRAARERNADRAMLLSDPSKLDEMAAAINEWRAACRRLKAALGRHVGVDGSFANPDRYACEKLATGEDL